MTAQLALFEPPTRKTAGEVTRERMRALARSPEVINKMLQVLEANRGEFVSFHNKCYDIWQEYKLGSYINDSLHYIRDELKLLEIKRIYPGAESPRAARQLTKTKKGKQAELEKPYMGYYELYRLKETA
jgi:hypothetical protein